MTEATKGETMLTLEQIEALSKRLWDIDAVCNAAPSLLDLAREALAARDIIPDWADMLNDLDIERRDWRADYDAYRALVAAHDRGEQGDREN